VRRPARSRFKIRKATYGSRPVTLSAAQQVFLHNVLKGYGSIFGHEAYFEPGLQGRLFAPSRIA